jgi:hypothetical protein
MGGISEKAISERAYHIWQREGCPHGRDFEHWVQAQIELEAEVPRGNGAAPAEAAPRSRPAAKPKAAAALKAPRLAKPKAASKPKKA